MVDTLPEEKLQMSSDKNYDICYGMINKSKSSLDSLAKEYIAELNALNEDLYRSMTSGISLLLDNSHISISGISEFLEENASNLKSELSKELSELMQISSSLSLIIDKKVGLDLLKQVKNGKISELDNLQEYVDRTVTAGKILAESSFPNIIGKIDDYNNAVLEKVQGETSDTGNIATVKERLNLYKKIYLQKLHFENKIMFGNFANFIDTTGTYFENYINSVRELLGASNNIEEKDELGAPIQRKTIEETIVSLTTLSNIPSVKQM